MGKFVPEKHYIGYHSGENPLAFITPEGTDAAAVKRKATVDNWSRGIRRADKASRPCETIDNPAMTGFRIADDIVKRWSTQNVLWRIYDPRGFQLEISSGNMAYILGNGTVEKGEIKGECRWCRNGATNYLLPVDSDEYQTYNENSSAVTIKTADLTIGDKILISNAEQVTYLGRYSFVRGGIYMYGSHNMERKILETKRLLVFRNADGKFIARTTLPKHTKLLEKAIEADQRDYSADIPGNISTMSWGRGDIILANKDPVKISELAKTMKFVEVDEGIRDKSYDWIKTYFISDSVNMFHVDERNQNGGRKTYTKVFSPDLPNNIYQGIQQYGTPKDISSNRFYNRPIIDLSVMIPKKYAISVELDGKVFAFA